MFRGHRAHHQERQIVSIQPLVTVILFWWPRCVQVGRRLCITLVIYQESLHDARSTKCKISQCKTSNTNIQNVKYYCFVVLIYYTFKDFIFITVCTTYMATLTATMLSCNLLYSSKF